MCLPPGSWWSRAQRALRGPDLGPSQGEAWFSEQPCEASKIPPRPRHRTQKGGCLVGPRLRFVLECPRRSFSDFPNWGRVGGAAQICSVLCKSFAGPIVTESDDGDWEVARSILHMFPG